MEHLQAVVTNANNSQKLYSELLGFVTQIHLKRLTLEDIQTKADALINAHYARQDQKNA
jgi:hypothetical protein